MLKGDKIDDVDIAHASVWLVRKAAGFDPPEEIADKNFDWREGWNDAWNSSPAGYAFLETLHHFSVELAPDGTLLVSGVPTGEYCLAIKVYRHQEGEKYVPSATRVVRFQVTAADVAQGASTSARSTSTRPR